MYSHIKEKKMKVNYLNSFFFNQMERRKVDPSHIHAIIIIASQSVFDTFADYSTAAAYYHYLLKLQIPSDNIICLCPYKYFKNFQDDENVKFQITSQQQKEYPSIRKNFQKLDFQNFPIIDDPEGIAYVILLNHGSKKGFGQHPNCTYSQIFVSFFTSLKVSQIICVDSSCYSGLIIDSYIKIQQAISKIKIFPNEAQDDLTAIFFYFQSIQHDFIKNFQPVVGHLQQCNIAYLNKPLLKILLKIGEIFLSSKYPSYTHFLKNLENVQFGVKYDSFTEFQADAFFVSKTNIEFPLEFLFIHQIVSILSFDNALNLFNIVLQPEFSSDFTAFIKCIQPDLISSPINLKQIHFNQFSKPVTIFASATSSNVSKFYHGTLVTINGKLSKCPLSSPFRSTILDMLFINPILDINQKTIRPYFNKIHEENGDTPQFFTSCAKPEKPFSVLNIKTKVKPEKESEQSQFDNNLYETSDSSLEIDSDSQEIKIVPLIPEELVKIDPNDKVFYPYETDENRIEIPLEDYRAGQFFKEFYFKLNEMLTKNQLQPLQLYRESEMPKDFTLGVLQTWNDFNSKTTCYIQYVLVHQFDYYCYSFAYLFQNNWGKMKIFLQVLIDTINEIRATSKYTEYTKPNYPFVTFNIKDFMEEILYDVDFGYPFP